MSESTLYSISRPIHPWLQKVALAHVPGPSTPVIDTVIARLLDRFRRHGHTVLPEPAVTPGAQVLLTSAPFNEPVNWRESLMLTARRRFRLARAPVVFTFLHALPGQWRELMEYLRRALAKPQPDPADFSFPGLARQAYYTLIEQGRRGGPIMAMIRLTQSMAKNIRNIVVVGQDEPEYAYTFDLVGAYPKSSAAEGEGFYDDLMYRILTAASTREITDHTIEEETIPLDLWQRLQAPAAMKSAGRRLGELSFFTEMVKVNNLVDVPLLDHVIASQYSEGCFATWEPEIDALVCTITGSARPVEKDHLSDDELAVITAVRPDGQGACVRQVEGKRNDPPSSEAVEMVGMDAGLPRIRLGPGWPLQKDVPVARSKLHGHRGVRSYDPRLVEFVFLDPPYYAYPVSCSTEAQALAVQGAFARSQALQNPSDPRQVVFTILPGHGVFIIEKWVPGKAPFDVLCEAIHSGQLEVVNEVPQGFLDYQSEDGPESKRVLRLL